MRIKSTLRALLLAAFILALTACGGPSQIAGAPTSDVQVPPEAPKLDLFDAIGQENVLAVKQHMNAGTDPASFIPAGYPWEGASALHIAVLVGNKEIVQLLLDNGADIEIKAKDQARGTPLQWAVFWGEKDSAEFMVNAGADINAVDNNGCNALCASLVPNPFVEEADESVFKKNRVAIQAFLRNKKGDMAD